LFGDTGHGRNSLLFSLQEDALIRGPPFSTALAAADGKRLREGRGDCHPRWRGGYPASGNTPMRRIGRPFSMVSSQDLMPAV